MSNVKEEEFANIEKAAYSSQSYCVQLLGFYMEYPPSTGIQAPVM